MYPAQNSRWYSELIRNTEDWYTYIRAYPKVSGLAFWSENCKWYSSLPL